VPVTVMFVVPVVAVPDAVKVKVEVAVPFAGGVTGLAEKAAVTPLGSASYPRRTGKERADGADSDECRSAIHSN